MYNFAAFTDQMTEENIETLAPALWAELNEKIGDLDDFGLALIDGDDLDEKEEKAFLDFLAAFEASTGLALEVRYQQEAHRGDEVEGMFWHVENAYIRNPILTALEGNGKIVSRKFYII
jgi:hypothetical protein